MTHSSSTGESAALSRELADFLIEFSIALHKNAIYPPGHPLLKNTVSGVTRRLNTLLQDRATLSLGVARHQLVIEGVATDPNHPLLRELAQRLHRHHLGAVRFLQGVTPEEVADVLRTVASGTRDDTPLGLGPQENLSAWKYVRLYALTYDQLELLDESEARADSEIPREKGGRGAQLWVGLARAALAAESIQQGDAAAAAAEPEISTDPVVVARAIDEHGRDVAYDQVIVGYLLQIAQELKAKGGAEDVALQRRISKLVGAMQPETLQRLLEMGGDFQQRKRFLLDASQGMAVDAVMDVVKAAADASNQTISSSLMRLLSKLAVHAENGTTAPTRQNADGALREHVQQLIGNWQLEDPNPGAYGSVLEGMSKAAPIFMTSEEVASPAEPERVLKMSMEVGVLGDTGLEAIDALISRGKTHAVLDLLDQAPPDAEIAGVIWRHVMTQRPIRAAFELDKPDLRLIERIAGRAQLAAASPLLDAAEAGDEKQWIPKVIELLAAMGPEVVPLIVERLPLVRWSTQRQLFILLGKIGTLPADFPVAEYVRHPDTRVRREVMRVLLAQPHLKDAAVVSALVDADEGIVRMGLNAVGEDCCPPGAIPVLINRINDPAEDPQLRALTMRIFASSKRPEALATALSQAVAPKKVLRGTRLAQKSPEMLAAVAALATHWPNEPRAKEVAALARTHKDPDIRSMVPTHSRTK